MKSTSETGHVKNVANFEDLISFCSGYGDRYNPSKSDITISALSHLFDEAQNKIAKVTTAKNDFDYFTGVRQTKFFPLKPLATRIINALDASGALDTVIKDGKTINRKLQGSRASAAKPKANLENPEEKIPKTISTSQQSFDRLIDSFNQLIDLVKAESNYNPNENELKVDNLILLHSELKQANSAVIEKYTIYSNSRIDRNETLYNAVNSLTKTALDVKKYVKSVFGASSPQYKQISSLKFIKLNL
jgi:hypothetical protein